MVWQHVTSTNDNCLGQECPYLSDCYLQKARRKAMDAELVVINHHLLVSDISVKETGFGEILPDAELVVIDEAHQLPDTATTLLGSSFTSRQCRLLAADVKKAVEEYTEAAELIKVLPAIELYAAEAFELFEGQPSKGALAAFRRVGELKEKLSALLEKLNALTEGLNEFSSLATEFAVLYKRSDSLSASLDSILTTKPSDDVIWYEVFQKSFSIHVTPTQVAKAFSGYMNILNAKWVFTSATLAIDNQFEHFNQTLGLKNVKEGLFESPFNFEKQAILYSPRGLPDTSDPSYTEMLLEKVAPIIEALSGRTFLLFTSFRAMNIAVEYLRMNTNFKMLVQGQLPKNTMLKTFKESENTVLLGTYSFWEGVDVRGDALSMVVIDKLPFASPDDPILRARVEQMKKDGKDAFNQLQVPAAIIALKQGIGRLIRDVDDEGVLVIGDPRLYARQYGKKFVASLPKMVRTREQSLVVNYAKSLFEED